jgi:hypothetical protein
MCSEGREVSFAGSGCERKEVRVWRL